MAGFFSLGNNSIHNKTSINSYLWHYYHHLQLHHQHSISAVDSQDEITRSDDPKNNNNNLMMMRMSSSGSGGSISCQDCGNQAKKDCIYMRCRTCCKSQGFDCATHVKSTWVPASVRRERHQKLLQSNNPADHHQQEQQQQQQMLGIHSKRRRDNNNNNNSNNNINNNNPSSSLVCTQLPLTTTNISSFSGGMEVGNFPAEVNYPATFRCVKVSSMDDNEEEYAYQTAVNIGGHVFKGILYDQGPDHPNQQVGTASPTYALGGGGGESSTMGPTTSMGGPSPAMPTSSSSPNIGYLDPSYYPLPLNAYLPPGTPFFPNPRP